MPYRPGIISSGEDYVGETAALNRKLRRTKAARVPALYKFDSEEELFDTEGQIVRAQETDDSLINKRKLYQAFWGQVKRQWAWEHEPWDCPTQCLPTDKRQWSCGGCEHGPFNGCLCNDGKKRMSRNRIVFWNSVVAREHRTTIYEINTGLWVPKSRPDIAPDWRELDWSV